MVEDKFKDGLTAIALSDVAALVSKGKEYGDSWKQRGGVGAFMMLARKWDRIEHQVSNVTAPSIRWDIFERITCDKRPEGLLDDIRDLRRYLMLVEEEMMHNG